MSGQTPKEEKLPCGRPAPAWLESRYRSKENRLQALVERLREFLEQQKLNQSESRTSVLHAAARFESHFTASELIRSLAGSDPGIGVATVYRSIQAFVQAGILRETLATDSGEKIYEVESSHHHDHIVCLDCEAIFEFHEAGIEKLQQEVLQSLGFREERHRHVVYARCAYRSRALEPKNRRQYDSK